MDINKAKYIVQWICILCFFAMLCFPLVMLAVDGAEVIDPDKMSEEVVTLPKLTPVTYFTGSFHADFEQWFSKSYPARSALVTAFRQTMYRWEMSKPAIFVMELLSGTGEQSAPSHEPIPDLPEQSPQEQGTPTQPIDLMAIYTDPDHIYAEINRLLLDEEAIEPRGFKGVDGICVGKSGYLYQTPYIDEYYGYTSDYTSITQEGIDETVRRLEYIQEELWVRYDITMVYLISPNKASMYEQFIPDHYKNRNIAPQVYSRPVDKLRAALKESEVLYLDSEAHYRQIGLLNTFTKTGIHWNHLASFEATAQALRLYEEYADVTVRTMDITRVMSQDTPVSKGTETSDDADIYHIMYDAMGDVPGKIMDEAYYYPQVRVNNPNAKSINILLQGGSFATDIDYYLRTYDIGNVRYIHYNGIRHRNTWEGQDPWSRGIMVWDDILQDLDLIIFEVNENYIRSEHCTGDDWQGECGSHTIGSNATYDSLYEFLVATE